MTKDDPLLRIFQESSLEQLSFAEKDLLDLESGDADSLSRSVEGLFRAIHTLKGDAGTLKFTAVVTLCHELETVLDALRKGALESGVSLVTDLLAAFDALKRAVLSPEAPAGNDSLLLRLKGWQTAAAPHEPERDPGSPVGVKSATDDACAGSCASGPHAVPGKPGGAADSGEATGDALAVIPVRTAQLDELLERLGEIMQAQSRLAAQARLDARWEYLGMAEELERQVLDMGRMVLGMRLLPLDIARPKYRRLVRDLATRSGKNVALAMSGEGTALDKSIIEKLNVPIVHLLRNAVRYGIEPPDTRARQGKPATGVVAIDARQEGNDIIITVSDDGAGIDPEAIHAQALAAGLVRPDAELTARQKLNLVFLSGLSTATTVDDISGRGVGLDAVRSAVAGLSGQVELASGLGRGTAFTIRIPVSLSLLECLRVRVGREVYYFPLEAVEECLEMPPSPRTGKAFATFALRGRLLPLVVLDALYGLAVPAAAQGEPPDRATEERAPQQQAIVALSGETRFGVAVDEVLGLARVMVKSLDSKLTDRGGFLGAALNEEGGMSLILDPRNLVLAIQGAARDGPGHS